jgi:metal-sulfur cluster biosynthetic enzyme
MSFNLTPSDQHYLREEVYDIIRTIRDPELPQTLEELDVVDIDDCLVEISPKVVAVLVVWTPTTPSCGFAQNIALSIQVKLMREFS